MARPTPSSVQGLAEGEFGIHDGVADALPAALPVALIPARAELKDETRAGAVTTKGALA